MLPISAPQTLKGTGHTIQAHELWEKRFYYSGKVSGLPAPFMLCRLVILQGWVWKQFAKKGHGNYMYDKI